MAIDLMDVAKVAKILGVTPKTIHAYVRDGLLGCVQVSARKRKFSETQLQEFIESRTLAAPKQIDRLGSESLPFPQKGGLKSYGVLSAEDREALRSW